jgi:hypothetical protein
MSNHFYTQTELKNNKMQNKKGFLLPYTIISILLLLQQKLCEFTKLVMDKFLILHMPGPIDKVIVIILHILKQTNSCFRTNYFINIIENELVQYIYNSKLFSWTVQYCHLVSATGWSGDVQLLTYKHIKKINHYKLKSITKQLLLCFDQIPIQYVK